MSGVYSSTPYPKRSHQLFNNVFNNNSLSPIALLDLCRDPVKHLKPKNPVQKISVGLLKQKKNEAKEAECASSAALKEMGVVGKMQQKALLSQSRNLYNMHPPELVIVSSDEESSAETSNKKSGVKKDSRIIKPNIKRVNRAASTKYCKASNTVIVSSDEENSAEIINKKSQVKKYSKIIKPDIKRVKRAASAKYCKASNTEPNGINTDLGNVAPQNSDKKLSIKVVQSKPRLESIENIQPVKEKNNENVSKKTVIKKDSSAGFNSAGDENTLSQVPSNSSGDRKRKLMLSEIEELCDISEEEIVIFTPRRLKKVKSRVNRVCSKNDSFKKEHKIGTNVNSKDICEKNKKCDRKSPPKTRKRTAESKNLNLKCPEKEADHMENTLLKGCVSHFQDLLFRPNKYTGCLAASSLKTDKLNFGYVEIDNIFTGERSNITFVVLEGKVIATLMGATRELSAGDILHVSTESGYKFEKAGCGVARLLYVKENYE